MMIFVHNYKSFKQSTEPLECIKGLQKYFMSRKGLEGEPKGHERRIRLYLKQIELNIQSSDYWLLLDTEFCSILWFAVRGA